jgi:hypothetical protein
MPTVLTSAWRSCRMVVRVPSGNAQENRVLCLWDSCAAILWLGGGGGVFTINIAEEDRSRRWRAHRHCANGRAVSPITCWVALAPKAEWAGGRRLLLSSGSTLLVGAPGRCSGRQAQLKPPFPVPVGRGRSYTAPGASGLHSPRRCREKRKNTHVPAFAQLSLSRRMAFSRQLLSTGDLGEGE